MSQKLLNEAELKEIESGGQYLQGDHFQRLFSDVRRLREAIVKTRHCVPFSSICQWRLLSSLDCTSADCIYLEVTQGGK